MDFLGQWDELDFLDLLASLDHKVHQVCQDLVDQLDPPEDLAEQASQGHLEVLDDKDFLVHKV